MSFPIVFTQGRKNYAGVRPVACSRNKLHIPYIQSYVGNRTVACRPEKYQIARLKLIVGNNLRIAVHRLYRARKLNLNCLARNKINKPGTVKRVRSGCAAHIRSADIFFCFGYKFFPAHADFRLRHSRGRKTMPRKEQERKDNSNTKKQANANFSSIHILIIGIFYRFF